MEPRPDVADSAGVPARPAGLQRVIGLDLSLSATGYACDCGTGVIRSKYRGPARLEDIGASIRRHARDICHLTETSNLRSVPTLVVLEGYAFNRGQQAHQLGELGGVVRLSLFQEGIPYVEVPPAVLKKFATGKGNAPKDAMLAAAVRRFAFPGEDNNEADAWLLRRMGLTHIGSYAPSAYQVEALAKVDWPDG